jgi:tRNA isopentenyl-2-thiomethyl-A-37 hydroxylase MiaE
MTTATTTGTLRCGVIGVGKMGRHHARLWTQVEGCDLVGVVDTSAERRQQVIDHLVVCALIEGRSCEKFQILSEGVRDLDVGLADFYASLVESEGNHYATYLIMARRIDLAETECRLDFFLDLDAELIRTPHPLPLLH